MKSLFGSSEQTILLFRRLIPTLVLQAEEAHIESKLEHRYGLEKTYCIAGVPLWAVSVTAQATFLPVKGCTRLRAGLEYGLALAPWYHQVRSVEGSAEATIDTFSGL